MPTYRVDFTPKAKKDLDALDRSVRIRIGSAIEKLETNPRHSGVIKLEGTEGYRVRVGQWRIMFTITDEILLVVVVKVRGRGEAYR